MNYNRSNTDNSIDLVITPIMRPKAINILLEVCFLSNKDDISKYDLSKTVVADVIASILSGGTHA